ncbi:hypothetical protein CVT24_003067 [Panaeolus cyanescens]|uniref:Uncharacterized protein n=1 Tax=Panaeolus cyanescens TaxID=181874 RepID=A0A409VFS7_9AGAR|nr:hypothetical protein CVT24_003067 [Panaeolus cyanescens]
MAEQLTNTSRPKTDATLTIRIIKSFRFRTERNLVLHHVNLYETTVGQLKEMAKQAVATQPGWKPYRTVQLDTMKLYTQAHGAKTSNLIINLNNDDWILSDDEKNLADLGFGKFFTSTASKSYIYHGATSENETEVSFFNKDDYENFKANPEIAWDS